MDAAGWRPGERAVAAVFSAAMLGSVLAPLWQYRRPIRERRDGFPLSWYPMFSMKRHRRAWVTYAVGIRADGTRRYLPFNALGPGGINQVRRQLYRISVREGRPQDYATALAVRVAGRRDCADVVRVEVLRTRFDLDSCLLDRSLEGEEQVLASAPVAGRASLDPVAVAAGA